MITQVRKTYKYRLYTSKRDKHLHDAINIAGIIWNRCIALQRRYYRLYGSHIQVYRMQAHLKKLRNSRRFHFWKQVGSQAVQEIAQRVDAAYKRFFDKQGGRPAFRKVKKYRSFTLKQSGWELLDGNKLRIDKHRYKFVKHREIQGKIKTVTIKRDSCNRLWVCFSVMEEVERPDEVNSGKIGGFDFGLKTFLTDNTGKTYLSPEFFKQELERVRSLSQAVSRKQKGSQNQQSARWMLHRSQIRVADKRRDYHYQLAHQLCDQFDVLVFEDLNIDGMKRLWGRKVSDLGFSQFIDIMQWVAEKRGKQVLFIDRFEPTSQVCSRCGERQKLPLSERTFRCSCGLYLDRDHNAALNIQRAGASAHTIRGDVRPT